ncbi:uncharacterized protein LOC144508692 [Mustelus asterias]
METENGNNSSSCVSYRRSEPYVYICKSVAACEETATCPSDGRDGVHLSPTDEEWEDTELNKVQNVPGCQSVVADEEHCQCQQLLYWKDDDGWVEPCLPNCNSPCKCGSLPQCALFPDAFLPCAQTPMQKSRKKYRLQSCNVCDVAGQDTGPPAQSLPLCNQQGCSKIHKPETVAKSHSHRELQSKEHSRTKPPSLVECPSEILKSPYKMKGGCSVFGLGLSKGNKKEQCNYKNKGIEVCQNRCNKQGDDLYVQEIDEIGTTCLSYKPSVLCSGDDDLCKSYMRHSKQEDRNTHCQRSAMCGIGHRGSRVSNLGIVKRCTKAATNKNACFLQDRPKVYKRCGATVPECVTFPRDDSSWLSSASRRRIEESSCSGKRLFPRNDTTCCNVSTSPVRRRETCRSSCLDHSVGGDTCTRQTDDVYVCELDDVGTSCLYYKRCPSPRSLRENCIVASSDDCKSLRELHKDSCKDGKLHSKDNCQQSSSKSCNHWQVPGRTKCAKCSENSGNQCNLTHGEHPTLCCKGRGACSSMMCSLPQWPRQLLLQNSRAQATTTLYKL